MCAHQVTACCFDKTGTLTSDDLVLRGVVPLAAASSSSSSSSGETPTTTTTAAAAAAEETILPPAAIAGPPLWILAACHSLMTVDGRVAGDPMERAAVEGLGWSVASNGDTVLPPPPPPDGGERRADRVPIRIHHRFQFSSALRRMSVLASYPVVVRGVAWRWRRVARQREMLYDVSLTIHPHRTPPAGRSTSSSSS